MPLQLLTSDQIPGLTRVRSATFGRNGSGKSTMHATIPDVDVTGARHRVLVASVDIENIRMYVEPKAKRKHYRIAKLSLWDDVLGLYELISASLQSPAPITDLVWDTWSRLQDLAIGKVTNYNPTDPALLQKYIERIPKRPSGWDGWGQVGALMNEWMANFNRLPINLYYLVQENDRENRTDNYIETGPRLTPEALRGLRDAMEIIGRLYVESDEDAPELDAVADGVISDAEAEKIVTAAGNPKNRRIDPNAKEVRKLFIGQHERYLTKGPTHLLSRVIVNPTWDNVMLPILAQNNANTKGLPEAVPA